MITLPQNVTIVFMAFVLLGNMRFASAAQWELLPERCHDVELSGENVESRLGSTSGAPIRVRSIGSDPYLVGRLTMSRATDDIVLEFEYFCASGIKSPVMFLGPPFVGEKNIKLPEIGVAEGWQSYAADLTDLVSGSDIDRAEELRIDIGDRSDIRIQIRNLHLRPKTKAEKQADIEREETRQWKLAAADQLRHYLAGQYTARIESVNVTDDHVRLSGTLPDDDGRYSLFEFPPEMSAIDEGVQIVGRLERDANHFELDVPRFVAGRDRLHHSWRLHDDVGGFVSPRAFANEIATKPGMVAARRPEPRNQKGLTGISTRGPLSDFSELGISAATLNLVLTRFVTTRPGPGRTKIDAPGDPVYFDSNAFASYDHVIDFARQNEIVISAIVLIPSPRRGSTYQPIRLSIRKTMAVSIRCLTSPRGEVYSFILTFLGRLRNGIGITRKPPEGSRIGLRTMRSTSITFGQTWVISHARS